MTVYGILAWPSLAIMLIYRYTKLRQHGNPKTRPWSLRYCFRLLLFMIAWPLAIALIIAGFVFDSENSPPSGAYGQRILRWTVIFQLLLINLDMDDRALPSL